MRPGQLKTTFRDGGSTALNFYIAHNVAYIFTFIAILLERWLKSDGLLELYKVSAESADEWVIPLRLLRLQEHLRKWEITSRIVVTLSMMSPWPVSWLPPSSWMKC